MTIIVYDSQVADPKECQIKRQPIKRSISRKQNWEIVQDTLVKEDSPINLQNFIHD